MFWPPHLMSYRPQSPLNIKKQKEPGLLSEGLASQLKTTVEVKAVIDIRTFQAFQVVFLRVSPRTEILYLSK
jgi:hypothetical protein